MVLFYDIKNELWWLMLCVKYFSAPLYLHKAKLYRICVHTFCTGANAWYSRDLSERFCSLLVSFIAFDSICILIHKMCVCMCAMQPKISFNSQNSLTHLMVHKSNIHNILHIDYNNQNAKRLQKQRQQQTGERQTTRNSIRQ